MGEHAVTGLEKWLLDKTGKDIYFWNFQVLMFFTLFEVGAVFFEVIPGTDIRITRFMVWAISDCSWNHQRLRHSSLLYAS